MTYPRRVKAELKAALVRELETALATARAAHQAAVEGATHAEARPENDKDTRGLEQSYLARGIAQRAAELEAAVATTAKLALRDFGDDDPVAIGAVVDVDEGGAAKRFFLASHGGGIVLGDVTVVTPTSPVGRALLGKRVDDEIEIGRRALTITAILLLAVLGCSGETRDPTAPAPPSKPVGAAVALARTFAVELVGVVEPIEPTPDTYAMSLSLEYAAFATRELVMEEHRSGTWRMTLGADASTTACVGEIRHSARDGQYRYESDPKKHEHSSSDIARLAAFTGSWKVVDGVGVIVFDHVAWGTCDIGKVLPTGQPAIELRCVGVKPPANVTEKRMLCEIRDHTISLELGAALGPSDGIVTHGRSPLGRQLVFGMPGMTLEAKQTRNAQVPSFTFTPGTILLDENAFTKH